MRRLKIMKKVALFALAVLAIVSFSGSGVYAQSMNQTVTLNAENASGQNGTATITSMSDNEIKVVIDLSNGSAEPQPVHIHKGSCANLDPKPAYPLTNLVNGKSETMVPVGMAEFQIGGYAINAHKSATEASVYVACGDIQAMMMGQGGDSMPGTGNGEQNAILVALGLLAATMTGAGLKLARRKA